MGLQPRLPPVFNLLSNFLIEALETPREQVGILLEGAIHAVDDLPFDLIPLLLYGLPQQAVTGDTQSYRNRATDWPNEQVANNNCCTAAKSSKEEVLVLVGQRQVRYHWQRF